MKAELDGADFDLVRRGYDRTQVDERLAAVAEQHAAETAVREATEAELRETQRALEASRAEVRAIDAARAEATQTVARLQGQVAELSTIPSTVDGMSERLQQMVRIAQDDVNDMRARATTSAAQILTMAQAEASELQERSQTEREAFEIERRAAEEELRSQLNEGRSRLQQVRSDADGQRTRLDDELAERRAVAVKELEAELEQGREAARAELAQQRSRQREEAAAIIDAATAEARACIGEAGAEAERLREDSREDIEIARRRLDELRSLHHQVSEQLTSVRALLDWTLPQMAGQQTGATADAPAPDRPAPVQVPAQSSPSPTARHASNGHRPPSPAVRPAAPEAHRAGTAR